ncbi:MAG: biotin/lipoyl-containing protein [Candidatus Promineifilaceae bacterium]|nr:biotin/lipoyl-containing protein [Candidatus Promineifilaceae bacterium]
MARFKFDLPGTEGDIEITRQGSSLHVTRGRQSCELLLKEQDGPFFVLEMMLADGTRRQIRAAGHAHRDQRQLWVNGHLYEFSRVRQRGSGGGIDGSLSSSIPAVVSQILVRVGENVTEGDQLILLESMKMVIPIKAPGNGIVKAIHCTTGDSIQAGVTLIELLEKSNDEYTVT